MSGRVTGLSGSEPSLKFYFYQRLGHQRPHSLSQSVASSLFSRRWGYREGVFFFQYKVTLKFLVLQNLETQARRVQIHQVTNKLLNPRVSVAIKKVLGAFVGWNGKRVFLSSEAVSPGGLGGGVRVRNSAISPRPCCAAAGEAPGPPRPASPTLNLPPAELLTQGQEIHSRRPDSSSAK